MMNSILLLVFVAGVPHSEGFTCHEQQETITCQPLLEANMKVCFLDTPAETVSYLQRRARATTKGANGCANHTQQKSQKIRAQADAESVLVVPRSANGSLSAMSSSNQTQVKRNTRTRISMISQPTERDVGNATVGLQRDSRQQVQDFTFAASVTFCLLIPLVWAMSNGVQNCPSSLLAMLSCVYFGLDNFIMAYAACYLQIPSAHAGMTFLFCGMSALAIHLLWLSFRTSYHADWHVIASSSRSVHCLILMTGMLMAGGQLCGNVGFNMNQKDSGPHQALVCVSVLIVAPFFYFYSGEALTKLEMMGCTLICGGVIVMSDVSNWMEDTVSMYSFLWLVLSMVFYSLSSITWRLSSMLEEDFVSPWEPQLLLIYGCMGLVGCSLSPRFLFSGGFNEYIQQPILLLWPALNAVASFLGVLCLNLAFQKKDVTTGAVIALVDSNSLALLCMNKVVLGLEPSNIKAAGMAIILIGCVITCSADIIFPSPQLDRQSSQNFIRLSSRALSAPGLLYK
mmetsp:Transcript_129994/g.236094  ORF Transcript_129994/g.236094 Transcript_129994/m.236094 type:complete len:512 (+) Transcript_129994:60-1595(+)